MAFIIDLQGFKRPYNEFVFKEMAIIPLQADAQPLVYFFEPPYAWSRLPVRYKSMNRWLTRNYHGLDWSAGEIPYEELSTILKEILVGAPIVYVKGYEKKLWLEKYALNVFNLDDFDCPSLKELAKDQITNCTYHSHSFTHCAVRNVLNLRSWILRSNVKHGSEGYHSVNNVSEGYDEVDTVKDFYNNAESFLSNK